MKTETIAAIASAMIQELELSVSVEKMLLM